MKKCILHLIPTLEGGGAERQLSMLASKQASLKWNVHIGVRRGNGVNVKLLRKTSVKIHELGDFRGVSPQLYFKIHFLIRRVKPDVIQTWLPQMDVVGGGAALFNRVPLVLSERASKLAFSSLSAVSLLRMLVGRFANAVVANSSMGAYYWQGHLSNGTILRTIRNSVDFNAIQRASPVTVDIFEENLKTVLVVGRLCQEKGLETVLRAIPYLTDRSGIRFIIMGNGPLRNELRKLIDTLRITNFVVMLPYQVEWWGWLRVADILVSMSRHEGNPNVVLEAMAAGCPLIVSDIPAHREILSDESACFVPTDNSRALAAQVERLLSDSELARKKSEVAKKYVDDFTIQRAADAYEDVYGKVIHRRAAL